MSLEASPVYTRECWTLNLLYCNPHLACMAHRCCPALIIACHPPPQRLRPAAAHAAAAASTGRATPGPLASPEKASGPRSGSHAAPPRRGSGRPPGTARMHMQPELLFTVSFPLQAFQRAGAACAPVCTVSHSLRGFLQRAGLSLPVHVQEQLRSIRTGPAKKRRAWKLRL
jgi:hypothetical protein